MCVIAYSEVGTKIPHATLRQLWAANPDGGGLAWAAGGRVHWRKGLMTLESFTSAYDAIPDAAPYFIHTRIATVGGRAVELTHPFLVTGESAFHRTGESDKVAVLAHNGHWGDWHTDFYKSTLGGGFQFPKGPMSDSRALAVLVSRHGLAMLGFIKGQRILSLDPKGNIYVAGDGWKKGPFGLTYSNTYWETGRICAPTMSDAAIDKLLEADECSMASGFEERVQAILQEQDRADAAKVPAKSKRQVKKEKKAARRAAKNGTVTAVPKMATTKQLSLRAASGQFQSLYLDRDMAKVQSTLRYQGKDGWKRFPSHDG